MWESKTLASAVKHYLRELPLMTYHLFNQFIEAAKKENDNERVKAIKDGNFFVIDLFFF